MTCCNTLYEKLEKYPLLNIKKKGKTNRKPGRSSYCVRDESIYSASPNAFTFMFRFSTRLKIISALS